MAEANIYREQLQVPGDRVISALDNMSWEEATAQAQEIGQYIGIAKTNSLHQRLGTDHAVATLADNGLYTFIDGKYHDIPALHVKGKMLLERYAGQKRAAQSAVHTRSTEQRHD